MNQTYVTLNDGNKIPQFGLGVYMIPGDENTKAACMEAFRAGYRHIDTAQLYGNEESVGEGIRASQIKRQEIFLTTKLKNSDQGYDATLKAFEGSLKRLKAEYLDLYLIHWPVPVLFKDNWREVSRATWKAMERLYDEKLIRAIGLSNFLPHNIQVQAWSPLGHGTILQNEVLGTIAASHGKTPAQIALRWELQQNIIPISKSMKPSRMKENADVFDFTLSPEEMDRIFALGEDGRTGPNPDHIDF